MTDPGSDERKLSAAEVLDLAEEVQESFRYQIEAGLFRKCNDPAKVVIERLTQAFLSLEAGETVEANRNVLEADALISKAYWERGWRWRVGTRFQPLIVLYNLAILIYLLIAGGWNAAVGEPPGWSILPSDIWGVPVGVLAFGAMGALLRVFFWLRTKVSRGELRPQLHLSYYLAPWVGTLFGALSYVVVKAGLWTFEGEGAANAEPGGAVLALAALAGFQWEWITQWLDDVMSGITGRGGAPEPAASSVAPAPLEQRSGIVVPSRRSNEASPPA